MQDLAPEDGLPKLVGFTVDHQLANPDFFHLVMTENIHRGEYLARIKSIKKLADQAKLLEKFKAVVDKHGATIPGNVAELQGQPAKLRK